MDFEIIKGGKTALVFGASGLLGSHVLARLLDHPSYDKIITFGRQDLNLVHHKLEHHIINFERIINHAHLIKGDDLFCCLGSTRRDGGGKEGYRRVDFDYCLEIGQFAAVNKVNQVLLVSTAGAHPKSFFFHNQVKGELENAYKKLNFWALHILKPSVIMGYRDEMRLGEEMTKLATVLFKNFLADRLTTYRPITAPHIAQAMVKIAQRLDNGTHYYQAHELIEMADEEGLVSNEGF